MTSNPLSATAQAAIISGAPDSAYQLGVTSSNAKHIEISRRYAWHARQRRGGSKLAFSQLIPRVRLRELERIFQRRYGRFLPDDDAGADDLLLAAHHIASLGGDVVAHVLGWARAWAPWMPQAEAREIADRVAAEPKKFTADSLAWRLRLSMIGRTELKITTIGAFDCSKSERVELRKIRDREAKRAKRAKNKSVRPRGRPRKTGAKNASTAVKDTIAVDGFSDHAHLAREVPEKPRDLNPSTKQNLRKISGSVKSRFDSGKGQPPVLSSGNPRAASPKMGVSTKPPSEVIDQAVEIVRQHSNISPDRQTVQRMLERFWPSYARAKTATAVRYYGKFNPDRDLRDWSMSFRITLNGEADAIDRHRQRRQKWKHKGDHELLQHETRFGNHPDRSNQGRSPSRMGAGVPLPKKEGRRCARPLHFNLCNFEEPTDAQ